MMGKPFKPEPMNLVADEIMVVPVDRRAVRARVRVWRVPDEAAVVLVEQLYGEECPSHGSCKFARRIWRDLLHYSPLGMTYYESEGMMLWQVQFDVIGVQCRAGFVRPSYEFYPAGSFDKIVGVSIFGQALDVAA